MMNRLLIGMGILCAIIFASCSEEDTSNQESFSTYGRTQYVKSYDRNEFYEMGHKTVNNAYYSKWLMDGIKSDKFKMFVKKGDYFTKQLDFDHLMMELGDVDTQLVIDPITLTERYEVFERHAILDNMKVFGKYESVKYDSKTNKMTSTIDSIVVCEDRYDMNGNFIVSVPEFMIKFN